MENRRQKENNDAAQTRRVKVYRQAEDGKWEDQGTGHVSIDYLERSEDFALYVIDEEDNETLLSHRICPDDIYQKQEGTIISWRDPEFSYELALSFQENAGCSYIWDHICNVQRNLHCGTLNHDTFHSVNSELRELPAVELSTLPLILKIVVDSGITDQMRITELILHDQGFFKKLMILFNICEDLENLDNLHMIYRIMKGIVLLNSPQIFEKLFGDELIMDIIGCLEYDPEVPHVRHRDFLTEHVVFKEAIPIKDPMVLSKIHQTYRIGYLKDVVLPRVLDDATVASLNSIVHANNGVVVSLLKEDTTFIKDLFSRLRSATTSADSKKNLVNFLHEFCTLSKSLQMVQQLRLFRDLVNAGLFDIISDILKNEDKQLVLTGTDILILFLNQDPNLLRSYVVRPEGSPLLGLLVHGMLTDFEDDMHCQFLEILRTLLDSYTLSGSQRDAIIEVFYEKHLAELVDVMTSSCSGEVSSVAKCAAEAVGHKSNTKPEILLSICELLCFCVVHHPYRIKCNFLLNNLLDKVLILTRRREKYLVVAAVRFVRTVISRNKYGMFKITPLQGISQYASERFKCALQDENLGNYIVKHNLLKPIVDAFVTNGDRYNLLNSAVLELFEYIRMEHPRPYVKYLVESFWSRLCKFDDLPSVHSLKVKYGQSLESIGAKSAVDEEPSKRIEERALEKEEEDYFNEDSDEEDKASASVSHAEKVRTDPISSNGSSPSGPTASSKPGGLVDYADDEDDEDYKPPPRRQTDPSDDDEGTLESLSKKRKLAAKEESGLVKKQRHEKGSKPKESVFAALCSTFSQAVLPNKKAISVVATTLAKNIHQEEDTPDKNSHQEKETEDSKSHDKKTSTLTKEEKVDPQDCSDPNLKPLDNGQLEGEDHDHPHTATSSSPEMAVIGS